MHWLHLISKLSDLFLQIYNTLILNQTRHSQVWFSWLPVLEGCIQKYNPPKQYWQAGPIILYEWCYAKYRCVCKSNYRLDLKLVWILYLGGELVFSFAEIHKRHRNKRGHWWQQQVVSTKPAQFQPRMVILSTSTSPALPLRVSRPNTELPE